MNKEHRELKIYSSSGYNYKETPTIMMKGQWLKEYGFEIGSQYCVDCKKGKIIITLKDE